MNFCVKCDKEANLMCSRCFEPYCGKSCQVSDWLTHKRICRPMPNLVAIDTFFRTVDSEKVAPKCEGEILSASSTSHKISLYGSVTSMMKSDNFHEVTKVDTEGTKKKSLVSGLKTKEREENVNKNIVFKEDLLVKENNVKSTSSEVLGAKEIPKECPTKSGPSSTTGLVRPSKNTKNAKYLLNNLEIIPIREGKNVLIIVTDTSFIENFVIAGLDYENKARYELSTNLKRLAEYCEFASKNVKSYYPEFNEICLAKYDEDGEYYRALVVKDKPVDDIYSVQFIDYGNVANVSRNNILPITEDLLFPTCTNLCRITNLMEEDLSELKKCVTTNALLKCDVRYNQEMDVYELTVDKSNISLK